MSRAQPWPYAPRVILKSLIQRAADAGFEPWVGAEVEYFLLTRNADGTLATADAADTAAQPCYDARGVTRMYDHLTAISDRDEPRSAGPTTPTTTRTATASSSRTSSSPRR